MTTLNIYSVRDAKVDGFLTPFFLPNDAVALRTFGQCANDPSHNFCQFSTDFELFRLGEFSIDTGLITLEDNKVSLGLASDLVSHD